MPRPEAEFSLKDVLITSSLRLRDSRAPDYVAETAALTDLARAMSESPGLVLQKLVDTALDLCRADSAGISLLETLDGGEVFRWEAMAGVYARQFGGLDSNYMPRQASPCGTTIDYDTALLMYMPERAYPAVKAEPPIVEALLIPFHVENTPVGTIWILAHNEERKFDQEDERIVGHLAQFASVGWQLWKAHQVALKQRNLAEHQLREARVTAALGTATAKIVHDLADPVNTLLRSLELQDSLLKQHAPQLGDELAETTDFLKQAAQRVSALIAELREFSRPLRLDSKPVDLAALVDRVMSEVGHLARSQGIEVVRELDARLPPAMLDAEKFTRAVWNLCRNAVEAMPDGGKLQVRCYAAGKTICVEVQDAGCGIPDGIKVFEPFVSSKPAGWGLGLAIVQQIITLHQGTIDYASLPGKGTTFRICLPVAAAAV